MGGERRAEGGLEGLGGGAERRLGVFGVPGFLMLPSALRQTARLRGCSQAEAFAVRCQMGAFRKGGRGWADRRRWDEGFYGRAQRVGLAMRGSMLGLRLPQWVQKGVLNPEPMNLMPAGVVISGRFF